MYTQANTHNYLYTTKHDNLPILHHPLDLQSRHATRKVRRPATDTGFIIWRSLWNGFNVNVPLPKWVSPCVYVCACVSIIKKNALLIICIRQMVDKCRNSVCVRKQHWLVSLVILYSYEYTLGFIYIYNPRKDGN